MPNLVLDKPARPSANPQPYIYTHSQVHALLNATERCQWRANRIDGKTLHMILLTLYATGATVDEALTLRLLAVNLKGKYFVFGSTASRPQRSVPIGADLSRIFGEYLMSSCPSKKEDDLIFCSADGQPIKRNNLWERFRHLHTLIGLDKKAGARTPRLQDFRYTFAVHRLTEWIRMGANLNELLPALSTYMGYSSLSKAEHFLSYVPERFRADLHKLSPAKGPQHWLQRSELLHFLSSL